MMLSTYTTLNNKKAPPTLRSRESLIPKLRSTPSSSPISVISNSMVLIANMLKLLMLKSIG